MNRTILRALALTALAATVADSAVFTVSKDGNGNYASIQAAVNAASAGDEIVIIGTDVYEEQVTIDTTKNGLILRSENPTAALKPTIRYQDITNIGPKNYDEAKVDSMITYDRNGALRIIGAANIRIEGLTIDGGGVYPYGYDAVWEGRYALQSGNAAVLLRTAGDVIVRDCELRNAYFGMYVPDVNLGGIYAKPNPADIAPQNVILYSGFLSSGNHLIEYNRIHDNSYGIKFEYSWNLGSTVRFNLIYENHHPTAAIATKVKGLSSEGGNQTGGAFLFIDHMLSPLAIYNNTLWHNSLPFAGNWKSGGQHLIFNNIVAEPNEYFSTSVTSFSQSFEMSKCFANRMHNCVYAAMQQTPTPSYTTITNDLKVPANATEGALITPFPATAEIRWVETPFLSTDPASPQFLVPDWNDPEVAAAILDKGWELPGVKDYDGTRADLGAVAQNPNRPVDVVTIKPSAPVQIIGGTARISFDIASRLGSVTGYTISMLRFVSKLDTSDVFGSAYKPIPLSNIIAVSYPTVSLKPGLNTIDVPLTAATGDFGFFEIFVTGTGSNGAPVASAAGFIPYRKIEYSFEITVLDKISGDPVNEVRVGQTAVLRVTAKRGSAIFTEKIDPTDLKLYSRSVLRSPAGEIITSIPGGISGTAEFDVVFSTVPTGGGDFVLVTGSRIDQNKIIWFFGGSGQLTVTDPSAVRPAAGREVVSSDRIRCELIDLSGRVVARSIGATGIADNMLRTVQRTHSNGVYLIRLTDLKTGRVMARRTIAAGR